jgi:hypothetical protein
VEAANGLGEQVRGGVPEDGESVGILAIARGQQLDLVSLRERLAQILDMPVNAHEDRLLRELRADRARGVEAGRAGGEFELRAVWKQDVHEVAG